MTERGKYIKTAFTLAEVLITLGIIGVVAAITLPNLIMAQKAHRLRSQFLKSYSTIQQAFRQMEADDISTDPASYAKKMGSFYKTFKSYFKGAHECGYYLETQKTLPCFDWQSKTYKSFDGNSTIDRDYFTDGQIVLPDGTLIMIDNPNWGDFVYIFVDINGYKSLPNRLGYDLFAFHFVDGELKTMGDTGTQYKNIEVYCNLSQTNNSFNGLACEHRAKNESDYFKWVVKNVK